MKTAPIFMTRQMMVNRVANRNNKIAAQYVTIADNLPQQSSEFLQQARLSIAKFARKHNCRLSFVNGEKGAQMNVERQHTHLYHGDMPEVFTNFHKEGEVVLPQQNVITAIKNGVKQVLASVKEEKTGHFHEYPKLPKDTDVEVGMLKMSMRK